MAQFDQFKDLIKRFAKVWLTWHNEENLEKQHEAADHVVNAVKIGMEFAQIAKEILHGERDRTIQAPGVENAMVNQIAEEIRAEGVE